MQIRLHHTPTLAMRTVVSLGLEVNTLADGFFHSATWVLVLAASIAAITAWTVSIQKSGA
jgi:hypothetical protein